MRWSHALAVAALLGAGCFSTPSFSGARDGGGSSDHDGGGDGGVGEFRVSVVDGTDTNTPTVVLGPNMRLVFANVLGKMPHSLRTRTSDNEWLSFTNSNYQERGIGVSLDHRYIVGSEDSTTDGLASNFEILETGPVRAKIEITWGGPKACSTDTGGLAGNTTTFAIYVDGRIARHDEITPANMATGCMSNVGLFHSFDGTDRSYYKFFNNTVETSQTAVPTDFLHVDMTTVNGFGCLADADAAVGTTFTQPETVDDWSFFEMGRATTSDIGLNYMINEGETLLPAHPYVADTLTALQATTCEQLGANVFVPYASPPQIIGAAWTPADGAYRVNASTMTAMAAVPPGAVFILDTTIVELLGINQQALQEGIDYVAQPAPSGQPKGAMFYLKKPLLAGDELETELN